MNWLSLLQKLVTKSDHEQFKHATVVLRGGRLLASGFNLGSRHSEVNALGKIWENKAYGSTIINIRIRRDGTLGNSRPCKSCWELCTKLRLDRVIYSDGQGNFKEEKF